MVVKPDRHSMTHTWLDATYFDFTRNLNSMDEIPMLKKKATAFIYDSSVNWETPCAETRKYKRNFRAN